MSGFWRNRRVLVTGHTGFKGSWLSLWLTRLGAQVHGMALAPGPGPNLFDMLGLSERLDHGVGDIRDADTVSRRIEAVKPSVVFHLAAQSLVLRSYQAPVETWQTNVAGTLHVLDALRASGRPASLIVVTTDKVYENREWRHPYRESDRLGGHDLYSSSKAATELLVASWRDAFASEGSMGIATARAGNVIGGGDYAKDRLVPDIVRALKADKPIAVRNPASVRPWQHVLDPLAGYLRLAECLDADRTCARAYNFGPATGDFRSVVELVEETLTIWPGIWRDASHSPAPHEAGLLSVASDLARLDLNWSPRWPFETAIAQTMSWYRDVHRGANALDLSLAQISEYEAA